MTARAEAFELRSFQLVASFKKRCSKTLFLFACQQHVPWALPPDIFQRIACKLLTSAIEAYDSAFPIHHQNESANSVKDRRHNIPLCLKFLLGSLEVSNIEGDTVNEPRLSVFSVNHFCFTMEPYNASISGYHSVR